MLEVFSDVGVAGGEFRNRTFQMIQTLVPIAVLDWEIVKWTVRLPLKQLMTSSRIGCNK